MQYWIAEREHFQRHSELLKICQISVLLILTLTKWISLICKSNQNCPQTLQHAALRPPEAQGRPRVPPEPGKGPLQRWSSFKIACMQKLSVKIIPLSVEITCWWKILECQNHFLECQNCFLKCRNCWWFHRQLSGKARHLEVVKLRRTKSKRIESNEVKKRWVELSVGDSLVANC